ncbi:MAG: hypothetical protein AB8V19_04245 [Candidatus Midichloria sp.]|uniref:FG-GAP repeat-containing protein n=1 Tax=Hyalomma marginatum TaxID=34627 RepID=A0A8S4C4X0_9ACAR|nr:FG-GAP repeat-containing protein [Hyalomma marginatum]CAG7599961.1 FG-GAP repeat-containing protein [Hyalomma marginatum]
MTTTAIFELSALSTSTCLTINGIAASNYAGASVSSAGRYEWRLVKMIL